MANPALSDFGWVVKMGQNANDETPAFLPEIVAAKADFALL